MQKTDDSGSSSTNTDTYCKLLHLYKIEFIDECAEILNQKETDFLRHFFNKMSLIIQNEYGNEVYDDITFTKTIKGIERKVYEGLYLSMKSSCMSSWDAFSKAANKKKAEGLLLTNFRGHCSSNLIPQHSCSGKGRFIQVNDSKGKTLYVICITCKQCYTEGSILMHCICCSVNFYSCVTSNSEKQLFPATWEKYHCNAVMNEQMRCIKCQDLFYMKNNSLFCKSCKYLTSPLDVVWKCVVCKKEFKSYAKVYNPLEFKMIKITVRNALLYKILIKPNELPCGCNSNPLSLLFEHKTNCKGILYYGKYNGKDMIVCSKCKSTASYNKFVWTCPICTKSFKTKDIKIFVNESDNLLLKEITRQIENKANKDNPLFSPECLKISLRDKDDVDDNGESNQRASNQKHHHQQKNSNSSNATQNITPIGKNMILTPIKINDDQRDSNNRQRNLSINLRERSGSKKKDNIGLIKKNEEDNDDDEVPYYSQNRNHITKRNEKYDTSGSYQSLSNQHHQIQHQQQKNFAIDNDPNNPNNDKLLDQIQPFFKSHYKNYQKFIPQKTINLGEALNEENSPNSDRMKGFNSNNAFSLTAGNFQRFRSNHLDRNYSNDHRKNPFKLINKESIAQKEEIMGYSKRTHEKPSSKLDKYADDKLTELMMPNIQVKGKHNMDNGITTEATIVKNLERELNSQGDNEPRGQIAKPPNLNKFESDNGKDINIDSIEESNTELTTINIEDYTIITQLGQGTFGKIYLVEDKDQKIYSLKKIVLTEELDIELILKEYQLVHYLQHDNVIKIIGYCQARLDFSSFVIYILMEVGLGDWEKEIKNHMDKQQYYSEKEIISILSQLVSALAFLQRKNVSHRDIKPGNVLVFKNSIYKIADFGEAKKVTQTQQNKQINTLRGTELYMSPLLFNGIKTNQLDIKHNLFKSDVFSLGLCIVYSMALTNNVIYEIRKMVDSKTIRVYLNRVFSKRHSAKLLDLIGNMLEINEANRSDFIELEVKMDSFFNEQQITKL